MSGFFTAFSSAEEAIANAKMNHSRSHSPICGGYEHASAPLQMSWRAVGRLCNAGRNP
jgi:hypothetical protein